MQGKSLSELIIVVVVVVVVSFLASVYQFLYELSCYNNKLL
jgi:hypothetical protein